MEYNQTSRLAIFAEGGFGKSSKTADGVIRYGKNPVVAVIDSAQAGKTVEQATGMPSQAPIVGSVQDCLSFQPDALLLGLAWNGGQLPPHWRPHILQAIDAGLDIINGLHDFLEDDHEIVDAARRKNRRLTDLRKTPERLPFANGLSLSVPSFIVLTVGSDCSVGKMTVSLELAKIARKRDKTAKFVATGQTGIMIEGEGIAIDRVVGDFMAGAVEQMVVEAAPNHDFILVEGQGTIVHPGCSGVTLALLHGACPHAMIMVHNPQRKNYKDTPFPIMPLKQQIEMYEFMAAPMRESKVVGVALNTRGMEEAAAKDAIKQARQATGLPTTDAVRYGADELFDAILAYQEKIK